MKVYFYLYRSDIVPGIWSHEIWKLKTIGFCNASGLIDDQSNINRGGDFSRSGVITSALMGLNCKHNGRKSTSWDLDMSVIDCVYLFELCDKGNDYPFFIIRIPDRSGSVHSLIFYISLVSKSKFLRLVRCPLCLNFPRKSIIIIRKNVHWRRKNR